MHSIAWATKGDLQRGALECTAKGFAQATNVSCHSFIRMARLVAPLMKDGGRCSMSYHGSNKVVANYSAMGPVKAALEAVCRYLTHEVGPRGSPSTDLARTAQDARGVGTQAY